MSPAECVEQIVAACRSMAGLPYDGEPVDQLEHALQCAAIAAAEGPVGDQEFVAACLLLSLLLWWSQVNGVSASARRVATSLHGLL